jgi:NAD(P)-dependent dehydrogenase (short-subunit alcohol dehydrogenase family)
VIALNLRGPFLCMKYQIPHMIAAGGGSIVLTSSVYGLIGGAGNCDYAASKWGISGLVKSAALEYARFHIRVNAIAPGPTWSEIIERRVQTDEGRSAVEGLGPIADPDDIAAAALFLLSEEAHWTTGCVLPCDSGATIR